LPPGSRLPSSRLLARELGVSRNTVLSAFDILASEGYTEAEIGSATRVSSILPETLQIPEYSDRLPTSAPATPCLSRLVQTRKRPSMGYADDIIPFHVSAPDLSHFPFDVWSRLLNRFWRNPPRDLLVNGDSAGYRPLRQAIAGYLRTFRSVECNENQVIITTGAQQALILAAQVLLNPGDRVWLENPGYPGLQHAITATGAIGAPVELDDEGISIEHGITIAPDARAAAVTPSHHYPTGVTMSLPRRLALLDWAASTRSWIIEDDYDSEFRYGSRPLSALQGLDRHGRVIYAGTFSKVMFPALRVGYLVVPSNVVDAFLTLRRAVDDHPPIAVQPALATFIDGGHFASHVRRMRGLYAERRESLIASLDSHFSGLLRPVASEAGMHICALLDPGYATGTEDGSVDKKMAAVARQNGINVTALSEFYLTEPARHGLMLGFAGFPPEILDCAARKLARILATT